jgi:hypothetical protein
VDIRVKPNGEAVAIEVNPMPAIFLPPEIQFEDPVISESLPGGHRALLNILLASYFMQITRRLIGCEQFQAYMMLSLLNMTRHI